MLTGRRKRSESTKTPSGPRAADTSALGVNRLRGAKNFGAWGCMELVPYAKTTPEYRTRFFRCAECNDVRLQTNIDYKFGCTGCGLVFGSVLGLLGDRQGHEKAMHLTIRT